MARARKTLAQAQDLVIVDDPRNYVLDEGNSLPNVIMGLIGVFIFFYIASRGWKAGK